MDRVNLNSELEWRYTQLFSFQLFQRQRDQLQIRQKAIRID